jgi:hypothetical protein
MVVYISLGVNCSPRIHIKRMGYSRATGYKTCPFDLCITPFSGLKKCLETDFVHFFEDLRVIPGSNASGNRTLCGDGGLNINNSYGMIFNHEGSTHSHLFSKGRNDDEYYIRNDFTEFRNRYQTRINNFKEYIRCSDDVIFVFSKYPGIESTGNIDDICNIFRTRHPLKTFTYLLI